MIKETTNSGARESLMSDASSKILIKWVEIQMKLKNGLNQPQIQTEKEHFGRGCTQIPIGDEKMLELWYLI